MNLRPILDRIIIKTQEPEETTSGGIIIANAKNEGIVEAEVLAVGPGTYDSKDNFIKPGVEVGNKILVNTMAGQKFDLDDEKYVTITNNDIVAVLS
jgi:chaperonin GroES